MDDTHTKLFKEIDAHLSDSMENNATKLIERDAILEKKMDDFEARLSSILSPIELLNWKEIRSRVDELRNAAKLSKLRLMDGDVKVKEMIQEARSSSKQLDEKDKAAIEIEREMHEHTGFTDIFKSLLMWKTSPEEKLENKTD